MRGYKRAGTGANESIYSTCHVILFYSVERLLKYFVNCMRKGIIPVLIIFAAKSYDSGSKPWLHQIQQLNTGKNLGEKLPQGITCLRF